MKKVLLSTVTKPFGLENENVMAELFHAQVTKAQGIFSLRSVYHGWGLEFIANNLRTPTTLLHYPGERKFIREVKKGYDYVGIGFVMPTWSKAQRMIELVRLHSPASKVILGGYGTVFEECDKYADYVCRGEGLQFMQQLLGETPVGEYNTPVVINEMKCLSLPIGRTGVLFAGLGCPNGCDFCCTSHFFKKKHIPLLKTGEEIYAAMRKYDRYLPERSYSIIDEDFLLDKKRVEQLYKYTSRETTHPRTITCFASAKSINQFDPQWLAEMGIDTIWIGVESKFSNYAKTQGCDMSTLFDSLHNVGINTLGSMIVGVDAHTPENIWEDIDYHISLNPTLSQFIIYSPCPTTPLWDRMKSRQKLIEDYPLDNRDGFHLIFEHDNFSAAQLERVQLEAFDKEYRSLGPSVIRFTEKSLNGYLHFRRSGKPIHIARKNVHADTLRRALPLYAAAIANAPSTVAREKSVELRKRIISELGLKPSPVRLAAGMAVRAFAAYTELAMKNKRFDLQPKTAVRQYNYDKNVEKKSAVSIKTEEALAAR
jgi:hypothetical protein